MKSMDVDEKQLRRRLRRSLGTGLLLMILAGVAFIFVQKGPEEDRAPVLLRRSFRFNESFWGWFHSNNRLSVEQKPPPPGKPPRVNGMLGLESPLSLKDYQVIVSQPGKKLSLPLGAFYAVPKVGNTTDFRCIEGWSEVMHYAGARFSDFLEFYDLGKKPDGSYYAYVGFETPDRKYYVSIDMESMLHPQTVLAYEMNEAPLSLKNGSPLRLIIPIKYGIKSLKRIGKIFFSDDRPPDYWAERGYDWYSGL